MIKLGMEITLVTLQISTTEIGTEIAATEEDWDNLASAYVNLFEEFELAPNFTNKGHIKTHLKQGHLDIVCFPEDLKAIQEGIKKISKEQNKELKIGKGVETYDWIYLGGE